MSQIPLNETTPIDDAAPRYADRATIRPAAPAFRDDIPPPPREPRDRAFADDPRIRSDAAMTRSPGPLVDAMDMAGAAAAAVMILGPLLFGAMVR